MPVFWSAYHIAFAVFLEVPPLACILIVVGNMVPCFMVAEARRLSRLNSQASEGLYGITMSCTSKGTTPCAPLLSNAGLYSTAVSATNHMDPLVMKTFVDLPAAGWERMLLHPDVVQTGLIISVSCLPIVIIMQLLLNGRKIASAAYMGAATRRSNSYINQSPNGCVKSSGRLAHWVNNSSLANTLLQPLYLGAPVARLEAAVMSSLLKASIFNFIAPAIAFSVMCYNILA
jgi:hypothetical protein